MTDQMQIAPPTLSPSEEILVSAVLAGQRASLGGQSIRASFLRELANEIRTEWPLPPAGIHVGDAVIEGPLDLEGCTIAKPLVLESCRLTAAGSEEGAVRLRDASVKRIALYDCTIAGALRADRAHIETAFFLTGSTLEGPLRLRGASIGEAFAMDRVTIGKAGDTAILADGLRLGGPWILREATINGAVRLAGARIAGALLWEDSRLKQPGVAVDAEGAVCEGAWILRRAHITGSVRFRGSTLKSVDAQNLQLDAAAEGLNGRGADIGGDFVIDGARLTGGVRLSRAHIAGEFSGRGAAIEGPGAEWGLSAAGLVVDQGVVLAGAKVKGGISIAGARIGAGLTASSIQIDGQGRAIEADVMRVGGNWVMRGATIKGSVRFAGAEIEGQVAFTESRIEGNGDLAIRADGASIRGGWFMGRADIKGLVRLPSARLGNEMRLRATRLEVMNGPALLASGVRIARELVLDGGFATSGGVVLDHGEIEGAVHLSGSRIRSAALARGGSSRRGSYDEVLDARYDETALSLVDARIDRLVMPDCEADRPGGIVDLSRAHVGSYEDWAAAWPPPLGKPRRRGHSADGRDIDHLVLDGLVYDHLANPTGVGVPKGPGAPADRHVEDGTARMRTRWLGAQSPHDLSTHFRPQPWVQLARRLAAQGYHEDSREVAIARRRSHRKSASASRSAKLQGWFLDVFALYGFNPWRTVVWMLLLVALFAGVWAWAGQGCARPDCKDEGVFVMALKGDFGQDDGRSERSYPGFDALAYSLDAFLPFVDLGYENHWRPNVGYGPLGELVLPGIAGHRPWRVTVSVGGLLYSLYVLEVLLGLVLTSLAVTGFTGLLKGEDEPR
ncbi:MAG: hypothetical protein KJZ80_16790 [Hyphomicrobiaceae bacterium]|nr:hypothetical protein [Hyphomicrobiaceae bacterium]